MIDWGSVSADYHPQVQESTADLTGVTKVNVNLMSFRQDVQVIYEKRTDVAVRMFTVWKESGLIPSPSVARRDSSLRFDVSGGENYEISVSNGQITKLKGGCIVRIDIAVPIGAQVEIYNVDQLVSPRFFPIDNQTFLADLDKAFPSDNKWEVINNYLQSYADVKKSPVLAASEVGHAVHGFSFPEEKFQALKLLHRYVLDRASLNGMIEQEFGFFDRTRAREICGL